VDIKNLSNEKCLLLKLKLEKKQATRITKH